MPNPFASPGPRRSPSAPAAESPASARFEDILATEQRPLFSRLQRMVGSADLAEEICQETLARAFQSAPREIESARIRAWLHRVGGNLAIDELRRKRRRPVLLPLDEHVAAATAGQPEDALAVGDALERISPHERFLLLLRFEGGFSHREIAALLETSEQAVRQRLRRARRSFSRSFEGAAPSDRPPRVLILLNGAPREQYVAWLSSAGADARIVSADDAERALAMADGLVVAGGDESDVDPETYGQRPRVPLVKPDLMRDCRDIAVIRAALEQDVPIVAFCRGHQLLNVALGGSLHQDLEADGAASAHPGWHTVHTTRGSVTRRVLGAAAPVTSCHHQAVDCVGPGLHVTSRSHDGLVEAIEIPRRRFAVGVQFYPDEGRDESSRRMADALIDVAAKRARRVTTRKGGAARRP
jgi:putative glutamine amidotransferase